MCVKAPLGEDIDFICCWVAAIRRDITFGYIALDCEMVYLTWLEGLIQIVFLLNLMTFTMA